MAGNNQIAASDDKCGFVVELNGNESKQSQDLAMPDRGRRSQWRPYFCDFYLAFLQPATEMAIFNQADRSYSS